MESVRRVEPDRRAVSNDFLERRPERIFSIEQQRVIVERKIAYPEMIMVPRDFIIYAIGPESRALRLQDCRGTERAPEGAADPGENRGVIESHLSTGRGPETATP